jgi:hypothetical protein
MSWLSDRLKEAEAQLNPFDGGKTAQTVRTNRNAPPAQTVRQKPVVVNNQVQVAQKPKQNVFNKFTDVFDANSAMDRYKRIESGNAELYQDQQRQMGIDERSINLNPAQRLVTTGRAAVDGATEGARTLGRGVGNTFAVKSQDFKNAQESEKIARDIDTQVYGNMLKLYRNGTPEQQQRAANYLNKTQGFQSGMDAIREKVASENDPKRLIAAGGSLALDLATLGVASNTKAVTQAAYQAAKQSSGKVTTGLVAGAGKFATDTAKTTAMGGASGGLSTYINNPNATAQEAMTGVKMGAAFGAALPTAFVAGSALAPVAKKATTGLVKNTGKAVQTFDNKLTEVANPAIKALRANRADAVLAFERETNPVVREQINRYIAQVDQEIGKMNRGGINGEPIRVPDAPQVGKTAIDPEIKQVMDAADKAIKDGDLETAKLLGESLPQEYGTQIAKKAQAEIDRIESAALADVADTLRKEAINSVDKSANDNLLQIADKIAKHFNAPKSLYKITGVQRTYNTPSGTLKVGGDAKSALDNVFLNGDITTFTKNINVLADKFGGTFKEIADSLKGTGSIDGAEYNILTKELYERFSKRPSYRAAKSNISGRNSAIVQGGSTRNTSTAQSSIADVADTQTTVRQPRVVPQVNEEMALTKASVQGVTPPKKPPVAETPPQLGAGKQKSTKYASKTVPQSEYVSNPIKEQTKKNAPLYTPENEKLRYNKALTDLKKKGDAKFENDLMEALNGKRGSISGQDVANAQAYAAKLDVDGNYAKASEIYDKISEHLTAAGQTIQAAAIMSRRSPEGLRRHAMQVWKKAGVEVTPEVEKELVTLTKAVKTATSPEAKVKATYKVNEFVKKQVPDNIWNKSVNIWRAGLLTSPVTTAGNLLANTGETAIRKGFVNPVATAADVLMSLKTGKRTMARADLGSGTKGTIKGTQTLPEYFRTGYQPGDANLKAKYENSGTINYGNGPLGKGFGAYVNGTYRLMGVADAPFRMGAQGEAISSMANAAAINKGLKGKAKQQFVQEYLANPPKEAMQRAADEGTRATFQNDTLLNDIASGLKQKLEKKSPAAKAVSDFVMPFVRTPSAIATRLIERTPIGLAKETVNQIVNVKAGKPFDQRAMAQSIGNGSFGAVAIGAGMALASNDLMTFGYPQDEKERKLWDSEGKQPYSVRVGDRWYSLNYLQPFGTLLAIGGQAKQDMDDGLSAGEASTKALSTAAQSIQEQSFLKGINGVLSAIQDPQREARSWMEQTFSSVTPNFVRAATRAADPVQRKATSIPESIKLGIPGLRDDVPTKNDIFGEPLPAKDNFLNQYVNPLRPSKVRGDDTTAELRRLFETDNGILPSEANKNAFGKDVNLDKKQVLDLNQTTGKAMKPVYEEVMKSDQYKNLSDEDKVKVLKKINDVVYGSEKIAWGVKNNVIEADGKKLTKDQIAYLQGQGFDPFSTVTPKTSTKTTKKTSTKKKSSSRSGKRSLGMDYKLFGFGSNPTSITKSLRQLLEEAQS